MPQHEQPPATSDVERKETEAQRIDRNWNELLQELRVTQTGVQVLGAFLVSLPFQSAFTHLDRAQRTCYVLTLVLALLTTVFVLAPVATHRVVFRRHEKDHLLRAADLEAKTGMVLLAMTLLGALLLVLWFLFGATLASATVAGVGVAVAFGATLPTPRNPGPLLKPGRPGPCRLGPVQVR